MDRLTTTQTQQLTVLTNLYERFSAEGDLVNADKMKQLILKLHKDEFILAFCGHFSAGKSSMINFLLNEQILPSSPIPTSANTVKLQKGENFAKVDYRQSPSVLFPAPYDYQTVKRFAKDGDTVSSITISSSTFPLPDLCAIMDTPGIDSTDDAHRVSTESALHLADAVFYVMDYNHVQSEVNFLFTKELMEEEKPMYLMINMIDKHDEKELRFEDFKKSVTDAFAVWNVFPEGIFFTSIRDLEHPDNDIEKVRSLIHHLVENRENNKTSIEKAAQRLANHHIQWLKDKFEEAHSTELDIVYQLPEEEQLKLTEQTASLIKTKADAITVLGRVKTDFEKGLETILNSAYIMPAATRELGRRFLEASQPDFKMGLLFSKKKTEAERMARLQAFYTDLQEKIKTQLDWHMKELAVQILATAQLHDSALEKETQRLQITISEALLSDSLKQQVNITGEYVLNYTNDLASLIKKKARIIGEGFLHTLLTVMSENQETQLSLLIKESEGYADFTYALELIDTMNKELCEVQSEIEGILTGERLIKQDSSDVETLISNWKEEERDIEVKMTEMASIEKRELTASRKPEIMKETNLKVDSHSEKIGKDIRGKEKLQEMSTHLKAVSGMIQPLQGFQTLYKELKEKAMRLANQTFTVALFGAFSAGKSSFANALMGESVLPVSPNPTTAAINKIMASDLEHKHGTATVKLKTEAMLLADVNIALAAFSKQGTSLSEAYELSGTILEMSSQSETGKTHLSFLRAFYNGLPPYQEQLGQTLTVQMDGFRSFAAEEVKSCLVDLIELYYDCEMTKQGMVLVDTPGADSINARHTGASFEYIKNSDAILFVTYYNHPFSKADREFLIQLGRVKDSFAMDKMFFIVNAVDLAQSTDELDEVLEYVTGQLNGFGIRFPKLFALTSKGALAEKLVPGSFTHGFLQDSGITPFQKQFNEFIEHDLTALAVQSAISGMLRTEELIRDVVSASKQDEATKKAALEELNQARLKIDQLLLDVNGDTEKQRLKKETDELTFYSKQRVFFRFTDFFKESFNPAVLKEDGQDLKVVLKQALNNLLSSLGFDFSQEMRATALRLEQYVNKLLLGKQLSLLQQVQQVKKGVSLKVYEPVKQEILEFERAFLELTEADFKKELALFKNPKAFFEKNEKVKMSDALQERLDSSATDYVTSQGERLFTICVNQLDKQLTVLQHDYQTEIADIFSGLKAALEESVDISKYEQIADKIKELIRE